MGWAESHTKGSVWVQSDGRWRPLYGYAPERPVVKKWPAVRNGRRNGKDAYPCRVILYAQPGYPDPWDLVVSVGLNKWQRGRLVAAYGQRLTTEERCKNQKANQYEGLPWDAVSLSTPEWGIGCSWSLHGRNMGEVAPGGPWKPRAKPARGAPTR